MRYSDHDAINQRSDSAPDAASEVALIWRTPCRGSNASQGSLLRHAPLAALVVVLRPQFQKRFPKSDSVAAHPNPTSLFNRHRAHSRCPFWSEAYASTPPLALTTAYVRYRPAAVIPLRQAQFRSQPVHHRTRTHRDTSIVKAPEVRGALQILQGSCPHYPIRSELPPELR